MLVQPALATHLLCRPVSIADSTGPRRELQVLCEKGALCYVLVPAFGTASPKAATVYPVNSRLREPCPLPRAQACDCPSRPPGQDRGVYDPVFHSSSSTSSSSTRKLAARAWPSRGSAPPAWESSSARFSAASTATRSESTVRPCAARSE